MVVVENNFGFMIRFVVDAENIYGLILKMVYLLMLKIIMVSDSFCGLIIT